MGVQKKSIALRRMRARVVARENVATAGGTKILVNNQRRRVASLVLPSLRARADA